MITFLILEGCIGKRSKDNHKFTVNFHDYSPNGCECNLYGEIYTVYGMGALGSDVNSEYLTDSTNFRIFIGTYDESSEMVVVKCKRDSISVIKSTKQGADKKYLTIESKTYSWKKLKANHVFE